MSKPKYDITVKLVGHDGNAFFILGKVQRALRDAKVNAEEIKAIMSEAMSGDYDDLLATCMKYVNVV